MSIVDDIENDVRSYVRELGTTISKYAKDLRADVKKVEEKWLKVFEEKFGGEPDIKGAEVERVRDIMIDEFNKTLGENLKDEIVREIVDRFVQALTEEMGKEMGDEEKMVG